MPGVTDDAFVPGAYWTPERARDAIARMHKVLREPATAAMFEADPRDDGGVPEEMIAAAAGEHAASAASLDRASCRYRRARPDDVPRMAALIASANLPPLFIDEFLGGFVIADCAGEIAGVGGLEIYGESGVIRSVVVDERARGWGLGRAMSELLIEDARAAGARTLYLMTEAALRFWKHLGFEEIALDAWPPEPRACWQWQFVSRHRAAMPEVHTMRMPIPPRRSLAGPRPLD
jgi:N-acetylglutamate synthase-like GNAT family acetyltransferase